MYACPHCQEKSISAWRKLLSGPFFPARCAHCDGLSWVSVAVASKLGFTFYLLLALVIVLGVNTESQVLLACATGFALLLFGYLWHRATLGARTPEELTRHRGIGLLGVIRSIFVGAS